ncbi:hypothetical protein [Lysinibacillus sp. SGAir0095]|uniref:hypothetical protein n=1 Tax=Lysinibacillus sp. SGAir0095 TaxID=2070463 RepID=UPI0010CCD21C|nr:hypothetical protein [Lysinibacillus sp. SGAir0095]QCR33570.1 hypothetical protein C1N55_16040 [Lysinibacillus sp. SGAir0095]
MVTITKKEIQKCYHFAVTAWEKRSQSVQQFGTDEPRTREAFLADQISGKLAELIFKKEIEQKYPGVEVQLDFEHYLNPLQTDNGDVTILDNGLVVPYKIDVKGSSHVAQWLLVERHKFWDLQTEVPMADRYVMVKFSNEMPTSPELRTNPESILNLEQVSGEVVGWANHEDFISSTDNTPWFSFEKGEQLISSQFLPKTASYPNDIRHLTNYIKKVQQSKSATSIHIGPPLDATLNVGLPIRWLNKELGALLNQMVIN